MTCTPETLRTLAMRGAYPDAIAEFDAHADAWEADHQRLEAAEEAIRQVLADEETGHWGPDVTMAAVLRAALAAGERCHECDRPLTGSRCEHCNGDGYTFEQGE